MQASPVNTISTYSSEKDVAVVRNKKNSRITLINTSKFRAIKEPVIYRWLEKSTGKCLIGRTDSLMSRIYSYHTEINKNKTPFANAVQNDPSDFVFGIVEKLSDKVSSGFSENAYIEQEDSINNGFNRRKGNGGGRKKTTQKTERKAEKIILKEIKKSHESPQKYYPLVEKKDKKTFLLSPQGKGASGTYMIKREWNSPGGSHYTKRYIGATERHLSARASEHAHYGNYPEKKPTSVLYREMHDHPAKEFSIGHLKVARALNFDEAEIGNILFYDAKNPEKGYNTNSGGGGPSRNYGS